MPIRFRLIARLAATASERKRKRQCEKAFHSSSYFACQ
jgi:hypothetical protein